MYSIHKSQQVLDMKLISGPMSTKRRDVSINVFEFVSNVSLYRLIDDTSSLVIVISIG